MTDNLTSKPNIKVRTSGPVGPDDVIVGGIELAKFASGLSQEIERLQCACFVAMEAFRAAGIKNPQKLMDAARASLPPSAPQWLSPDTMPTGELESFLVTNEHGQVAPMIRGTIQNNVGTDWDWSYPAKILGWMSFPKPISSHVENCDFHIWKSPRDCNCKHIRAALTKETTHE